MNVPDGNTIAAWGTAIATLIIIIRQQMNAEAGRKRGEGDSTKISDIHQSTMNGQVAILETRATAFRALATLRGNLPADVAAAQKAEQDLADFLENQNRGAGDNAKIISS